MRRNDGTATVLYVVYMIVSVIAFWGIMQLLGYVGRVANETWVTEQFNYFFMAVALFGFWLSFEQLFAAKASMPARVIIRLLIAAFCLPGINMAGFEFMYTYVYSKIPGGRALNSQWLWGVLLLFGGCCLGQAIIDVVRFIWGGNGGGRDIFDR